uniref:WD-repeat protein n=1 Tax=Solanum tuberosum TaxID=4113 RepID=M1B401_SOLTU
MASLLSWCLIKALSSTRWSSWHTFCKTIYKWWRDAPFAFRLLAHLLQNHFQVVAGYKWWRDAPFAFRLLAHLLQNHFQVVEGRPICLQIQVVRKHEHYHLTYLMHTALDLLDVLQQLGGYLNCCRKMTRLLKELLQISEMKSVW